MPDNIGGGFAITRETFADPEEGLMSFFVESVHECLREGESERLQTLVEDMAEVANSIYDLLEEVQKAKAEYDRLIAERDARRQNSAANSADASAIEDELARKYGLKTTAEREAEEARAREEEIQRRIEEEAQRLAEERVAQIMAEKARETGVVFDGDDDFDEEPEGIPDGDGEPFDEPQPEDVLGEFDFDDEPSAPAPEEYPLAGFEDANISDPDVFAELSDDVFANVSAAEDPFSDVTASGDDPFSSLGLAGEELPGSLVPFEPDVSDELKLEEEEELTSEQFANNMLDIWAQSKKDIEDAPQAPVFEERVPIQLGEQPPAPEPEVPQAEPAHVQEDAVPDLDMFIDEDLFNPDELDLEPDELSDVPPVGDAAAEEPVADDSIFDDDFDDIPMGGMLS